jgi:hypothetical protein
MQHGKAIILIAGLATAMTVGLTGGLTGAEAASNKVKTCMDQTHAVEVDGWPENRARKAAVDTWIQEVGMLYGAKWTEISPKPVICTVVQEGTKVFHRCTIDVAPCRLVPAHMPASPAMPKPNIVPRY